MDVFASSEAPWKLIVAGATAGLAGVLAFVAIRRAQPGGPDDASNRSGTAALDPQGGAPEADVPRWLRPSVRAARFESERNKAPRPARPRLEFDGPPDAATERLVVRYDLVQLLDRPDEALGVAHLELDAGDEVDVIDRDIIWAHVRTPTGPAGWVPAMTLASPHEIAPDQLWVMAPPASEARNGDGAGPHPPLEALLREAAERRAQAAAEAVTTEAPTTEAAPPDKARKKKAKSKAPAQHPKKHKKAHRR